jgi:DNA polymerase III gamma/tau subunit
MNYIIRGPYIKALEVVSDVVGINTQIDIDGSVFDQNIASELINRIDYKPDTDRRYVVVGKADSLTIAMQNKLLKLIEEGREFNSFIFLSSRLLVLPTIQSRCVIRPVSEITVEDVVEYANSKEISLANPAAMYTVVENNSDNIDYYLENQEYFSTIYSGIFNSRNYIKLFGLSKSKEFDEKLIPGVLGMVYYRFVAELLKTGKCSKVTDYVARVYKKIITTNDFTQFVCILQGMIKEEDYENR